MSVKYRRENDLSRKQRRRPHNWEELCVYDIINESC